MLGGPDGNYEQAVRIVDQYMQRLVGRRVVVLFRQQMNGRRWGFPSAMLAIGTIRRSTGTDR